MAETTRPETSTPGAGDRPEPTSEGCATAESEVGAEPKNARSEEGEDKDRTPWIQKLSGLLANIRSLTTNLVTVFVVLAVVVTVAREVWRETVVIDPIETPGALAGDGYKPTVLSQRVMDEMLAIRRIATTRKERREVSSEAQQIDIDVPGTGLSVRAILRIVRGFLRLPEKRVSGEIVHDGDSFTLTLRIAGRGTVAEVTRPKADALDDLLKVGARDLMKAIDPYILASYLAAIGDDGAVDAIKYCIVNDPPGDDAWAYNLWGLQLAKAGSFDAAIEKYKLAIAIDPNFALPHNNWGAALHQQKNYAAAIDKYKEARDVDRKYAPAYNNWGNALEALDKRDAAIDIYRRATAIDSDDPAAHVNLAAALAKSGDVDAARKAYERAAEVGPGYARGFREWGGFLRKHGEHKAASAKYLVATVLEPGHALTYFNWGRTLSELGDFEAADNRYLRASAKYAAAAKLEPGDALTYYNWGLTLSALREFETAEDRYQRAIDLDPNNAEAHNNLGFVLEEQGKYQAAAQAYGKAATIDKKNAAFFRNWGNALFSLGGVEKALDKQQEMFEQALEKFKKEASLNPKRAEDPKFQELMGFLRSQTAPARELQTGRTGKSE